MRADGVGVTSPNTQIKFLEMSNVRAQIMVAKTTESVEVMEKIINKGDPRLLVALASNINLPVEIEEQLAELSQKHPAIGKALLSRNE
jgi:hypothetical protein